MNDGHRRMLRALACEKDWISLPLLCERAGIAKPTTGRVYLCRLRAILGERILIESERDHLGRALYLMTYIEDGILPRCPHCQELV